MNWIPGHPENILLGKSLNAVDYSGSVLAVFMCSNWNLDASKLFWTRRKKFRQKFLDTSKTFSTGRKKFGRVEMSHELNTLIEVIWISRFIVHDVGIHTCGPYFISATTKLYKCFLHEPSDLLDTIFIHCTPLAVCLHTFQYWITDPGRLLNFWVSANRIVLIWWGR